MKKSLIFLTGLSLACCISALAACDTQPHSFSAEWESDESYHWHACLDDGCTEINEKAEHNFVQDGTVSTCTDCQYSYNTSSSYEVNVTTLGNTALAAVEVKLYDEGNTEIASATTNIRGKARFRDVTPANYTAKIVTSTLPLGYLIANEDNIATLTAETKSATIAVASEVIDAEMPAGTRYELGDVVYDFTTTAVGADGSNKSISLSAYLSVYDVVVLNFWFASCGPCLSEFPHMDEAFLDYSDKVALIAIDNGSDDAATVNAFVAKNGYTFDFVNDESMFTYYNAYGASAFPTTVVIDKYGAVAAIDAGSRPSASAWTSLFDYYISEDYVPDYTKSNTGEDESGGESSLSKPDIPMPSTEDIATAITGENDYTNEETFLYSAYDDEYSWPWVITEWEGYTCLKTTNQHRVASYSILVINVQMKKGQQLFADYFVSTELEEDLLYIQVDKVLQYTLSGEDSVWNNDNLLYVARRDGNYRITLTYQKSTMTNAGEDTVFIKNLRLEEDTEISEHYDLLYNATDNYTLDETVTVPAEYTGFLNHVPYYYNETDGFYHVSLSGNTEIPSIHDPILYADLYYSTPWNFNSVWMLAYSETGLFNPADKDYKEGYYEAIEDYAWIQNNNVSRYVPLNKELQKILADVVADLGRTDNSQDPHEGVDQWLEICRYYVNYGTPAMDEQCLATDNTVEALKWRVAKDYGTVDADNPITIDVNVYSVHLPRGNYYAFKPLTTGAYLIRSHEPNASDYDVNALNPLGFLCDAKGNILEENDDFVIEIQGYDEKNNPLYDNNFYLYVYLEAGKTYYVGACFNDPYAMGEYEVTVSYIGESFQYFTSCAYDTTFTYDENDPNFELFILPKMGKDRFFIGDDGRYYAQEFDGSQGSLIYIRLIGATFFNGYTEYTLEQMIENDLIGDTLEEKLYMKGLLITARTAYEEGNELYGFVPAEEKLVAIINRLANGGEGGDSTTYSSTSWLLTAYYYRNVDENSMLAAEAKYQSTAN